MKAGTVLIVDDSADDVFALKQVFTRSRILNPLVVLSHGEQALAYLKGESPYDSRSDHPFPFLLILDLRMPRLSGLHVLEWIRQQTTLPPMAVIATTDEMNVREMNAAYRLGAHSFLTKPLKQEDFTNLVEGVRGIRICPAHEGYLLELGPKDGRNKDSQAQAW